MDKVLALMEDVGRYLTLLKITDFLDVAIIFFLVYKLLSLVKSTRAENILKGIGIFLLALLAAALLPKARGAALLETQLSFDALFEADYYFAPETAFETGLLRLCDLPDLAKLAGRVCAFTPKNPAGGSLAPHTPTPIPAHWEKDALSAAAEWLEDKLC